MIPTIATYLAIAASFWGQPTNNVPTVEFSRTACGQAMPYTQTYACSTPGHIYIVPELWFSERRVEKCVIILHEYGHAVMGLRHSSTGVMMEPINDAIDWAPKSCISPPIYEHAHCFYPWLLIPWGCHGDNLQALISMRKQEISDETGRDVS